MSDAHTLDLRYKPETVYTTHHTRARARCCVPDGKGREIKGKKKNGVRVPTKNKNKNLGAVRGEWPRIVMVMNREPDAPLVRGRVISDRTDLCRKHMSLRKRTLLPIIITHVQQTRCRIISAPKRKSECHSSDNKFDLPLRFPCIFSRPRPTHNIVLVL